MVNCPQCGRDIYPTEGQRFCQFCGADIELPSESAATASEEAIDSREPAPPSHPHRSREEYSPWEDLDNLGFVQAILATLQQTLFDPVAFFKRMPRYGGLLNPFLYGLLIGSLGAAGTFLISFLVKNPFLPQGTAEGGLSIGVGLLIPIFVGLRILLEGVLLHLAVFLTGGVKHSLEATMRVVCYTLGPELFEIVPVIGWLIALIWKLYITVVGIREVHELSTGHSVLAVFLPFIVCCGFVSVIVVFAVLAIHA